MIAADKLTAYCLAKLLAYKEEKTIEEVIKDADGYWRKKAVKSVKNPFPCDQEKIDTIYKMYPNFDIVKRRNIRKVASDKDIIAELVRRYSFDKVKASLSDYIAYHNQNGFFQDFCRALRSLPFGEDEVVIDQKPVNKLLNYD